MMTTTTKSDVEYRFVLDCTTDSVLHVGSGRPGPMTDAELRRNSKGQFVIPGTAIAGTVRHTLERLAGVDSGSQRCQLYTGDDPSQPCSCKVCAFMGNVAPGAEGVNRGPGRESKVSFFDAEIVNGKSRVVDSVAIDRGRRAASDARKFDYAQLLPEAAVVVEVRAENLTEEQFTWLATALRMLAEGQVRVGGRTNRGHGRLRVRTASACKIYARNLAEPDALLRSVTHRADAANVWNEVTATLDEFPKPSCSAQINVSLMLQTDPRSSLLIVDPVAAARTGFDRGMRRLGNAPEMPVASLIGALRSGAERILRTIEAAGPAGRPDAPPPVCDPLSDKRCNPPKDAGGKPVIRDNSWCCLICRVFGNQDWASRLSADVRSVGSRHYDLPMDHVAIDRFTGGASDQKKFDALAVRRVTFRVGLHVDLSAETERSEWIVGLLALVLRDLNQGHITLGHGAAKGHGFVCLSDPVWDVPVTRGIDVTDLQSCVKALWRKLGCTPPPSTETD